MIFTNYVDVNKIEITDGANCCQAHKMLNMQKNRMAGIESKVGASIAELRKKRKLTQKKFAELLTDLGMPVDASAVSRMEKGERALRISECLLVAECLEVELSSLLGRMMTPKQRLQEGLVAEEIHRSKMGSAAWDWLVAITDIQYALERRPELATEVGLGLKNSGDYLNALAKHLSEQEYYHYHFGDEAYIYAKNESDRQEMLNVVASYFAARIVVDEDASND